MVIREDLVTSAITFLQDPSVANAPLDKRVAFLQSKNLTQEEIDASLARAGNAQALAPPGYASPQQQIQRPSQPPAPGYGYGAYQGAYWQQPPPELPRRDWRDYFIMATVVSGLSYGIYTVTKRYIAPLIAPPTPPQLEQDKASINESFSRAFELIDQLSTDTATIKASEEARKERLDSALSEFELAIQDLKEASRRRDDDSRRIGDDVRNLQTLIPKAIAAQESNADTRLKELNAELKSLKTLVSNRVNGPAATVTPRPAATSNAINGSGYSTPVPGNQTPAEAVPNVEQAAEKPAVAAANSFARPANRGGIPAWQLAASKKRDEEAKDLSASGTVSDANGTTESAS